jgi:hypothetical protein
MAQSGFVVCEVYIHYEVALCGFCGWWMVTQSAIFVGYLRSSVLQRVAPSRLSLQITSKSSASATECWNIL